MWTINDSLNTINLFKERGMPTWVKSWQKKFFGNSDVIKDLGLNKTVE